MAWKLKQTCIVSEDGFPSRVCQTCVTDLRALLKEGRRDEENSCLCRIVCSDVFFMAFTASADPRMETKGDFCHCTLDPIDTDNEVFISDCGSSITVQKDTEVVTNIETEMSLGGEPTCDGYSANGYARVTRNVRETAAPLPAGERIRITSEDSKTPCVMVESNGRAYKSHNWISSIKVRPPNEYGMVKVVYELICFDGV